MKRFRLNNKGFAMAGVLYPLLILFLMLLLGSLGTLASRKLILDKAKKEAQQTLNDRNTYHYVSDGLVAYYDGYIGPEKVGNDFVWKDQSSAKSNGVMVGFDIKNAMTEGAMEFTGSQYVRLKKMDYNNVTIEAVVKPSDVSGTFAVVANLRNGGYGIEYYPQSHSFIFQVNVGGGYIPSSSANPYGVLTTSAGNMRYLSGSFDGKNAVFFQDGAKHTIAKPGSITAAQNNTVMMIGADPNGSQPGGNYFKGKIYSIRIYNRALTEDEVLRNYSVDKKRFAVYE